MFHLKGSNCAKVTVVVSNTSLHDALLKNRSVIGTLQLVRSETPVDVKWKALEKGPGQRNKVIRSTEVRILSSQLPIKKDKSRMFP